MLKKIQIMYPLMFILFSALPLAGPLLVAQQSSDEAVAPVHMVLKSFNLCLASTVISITSVLNFSLAAALAILLGLPTILSGPGKAGHVRYAGYALLGLGWLVLGGQEVQQALWNWEVLGVWFAPFVCIVYTPLVIQAGIASVLRN